MSNVLAIAAVTQLLKDLLNDALVDGDATAALGADFTVSALPPHLTQAAEGEAQPTMLNVFLHSASPNAQLRNLDQPTRAGDGALLRTPTLALDLHYVVTASSAQELHAEILLGYAMLLFHEMSVLPREAVQAALSTAAAMAAVSDAILPDDTGLGAVIRASEIADQLELLRIRPRALDLEDMSRLWTTLQAGYRATVAYDVSVVLMSRERPVRPTLPVLTRGGPRDALTGRDPGVPVRPDLAQGTPLLEMVAPADGQPAMRLGRAVDLRGQGLDAPGARVRFREPGTGVELLLAPREPLTSGRLGVALPGGAPLPAAHPLAGTGADPGAWRVGPYVVDVAYDDPARPGLASNALSATLAPAATPTLTSVPGGTRVAFAVAPPVRPGQAMAVLAGTAMASVPSPAAATGAIAAVVPGLTPGARVAVRLRVDGVDSPVIDRAAVPPVLLTEVVP